MFKIDDSVEFFHPKARKYVLGVIVDEKEGACSVQRPNGEVSEWIEESKIRAPGAKKEAPAKKKAPAKAPVSDPASVQLHRDFQRVYDLMNTEFFDGELPGCFWTTIQKRSVIAHFKSSCWVEGGKGNGKRDEIMINPDYLSLLGLKDYLSSILHEMVHQYQYAGDTPPRKGYHDNEFAVMMETFGLMPSSTGKEGGKKVGQKMDHYIIEGGKFDRAITKLIKSGFNISWVGAIQELHGIGTDKVAPIMGMDFDVTIPLNEDGGIGAKPAKKKSTRSKFVCPEDGCKENAQAKHTACLMCGTHKVAMVAVET